MVMVNQSVADDIATLVARHRYAVEDSKDAVKAAEAASAKNNEEIKQAAADRTKQAAEQTQQAAKAVETQNESGKARNDWTAQPRKQDWKEIGFGAEDDFDEHPAAPAANTPPPPPALKPAPRRQPVYDDFDDEDYENRSWLR